MIGTIRFLSDFNLLQLYRYRTCLSPAAVEAGCGSQRPRAHQPPRAGDPGRLAHMTTCAAGDGCLHPLKALIQPEAFNKHSCQGVCGGTLHGMCGSSLPDPITGQLDDNRRTCFRCGDGAGAAAAPAAPAAPPAAAAAAVHLQPVAEAATAATTQVSTHTHTHTHQCHHALL